MNPGERVSVCRFMYVYVCVCVFLCVCLRTCNNVQGLIDGEETAVLVIGLKNTFPAPDCRSYRHACTNTRTHTYTQIRAYTGAWNSHFTSASLHRVHLGCNSSRLFCSSLFSPKQLRSWHVLNALHIFHLNFKFIFSL